MAKRRDDEITRGPGRDELRRAMFDVSRRPRLVFGNNRNQWLVQVHTVKRLSTADGNTFDLVGFSHWQSWSSPIFVDVEIFNYSVHRRRGEEIRLGQDIFEMRDDIPPIQIDLGQFYRFDLHTEITQSLPASYKLKDHSWASHKGDPCGIGERINWECDLRKGMANVQFVRPRPAETDRVDVTFKKTIYV
ncbi:MAG: hypothetical protein V4467_02000 [Patescibacteria group bacterium]